MWITSLPVWTRRGCQSFFCAHPVDYITAGSSSAPGLAATVIPNPVPRLRTAPAACLHSLWDLASGLSSVAWLAVAYVAIAAVSLGLLLMRLDEARRDAKREIGAAS